MFDPRWLLLIILPLPVPEHATPDALAALRQAAVVFEIDGDEPYHGEETDGPSFGELVRHLRELWLELEGAPSAGDVWRLPDRDLWPTPYAVFDD